MAKKMVAQLTAEFWPPQDFPNPYTDTSHPATSFVTATLYAEQWSLRDWLRLSEKVRELVADFPDLQPLVDEGDFDVFFREFCLSPEPLKRLKTTPIDAYVPLDKQAFYLPIFPGMTANDIRQAAPAIAEWIEIRFAGRMPEDRMVELAAEGLTQQAIADQLGVDRKTVGDVLRRVTFRPKPNIT